jgi:phosphomannomutase
MKVNGNLKIVWDTGNGATCDIVKEMIHHLPGQHIIINDEIDGDFPSHPPDPTKEENLKQIKKVVHNQVCDFGIALDGDGDRLVLINKNGQVFLGDQLLAFFAKDALKRNPNAKIIADVKASSISLDEIKALGGQVVLCKTGHSNIKTKMLKENAILAGEVSGHLFFKENYYGYDDALFAACKLIFLLLKKEHEHHFDDSSQNFISPEIRLFYEKYQNLNFISRIKNILNGMCINYLALDGIRVESEKGWYLVRSSNTENALVIRMEGYSQDNFNFILKDLSNILRKVGVKLPLDKFRIRS